MHVLLCCAAPAPLVHQGSLLTLQGAGAYDAAVHCASVSAARRILSQRGDTPTFAAAAAAGGSGGGGGHSVRNPFDPAHPYTPRSVRAARIFCSECMCSWMHAVSQSAIARPPVLTTLPPFLIHKHPDKLYAACIALIRMKLGCPRAGHAADAHEPSGVPGRSILLVDQR